MVTAPETSAQSLATSAVDSVFAESSEFTLSDPRSFLLDYLYQLTGELGESEECGQKLTAEQYTIAVEFIRIFLKGSKMRDYDEEKLAKLAIRVATGRKAWMPAFQRMLSTRAATQERVHNTLVG